MKLETALPVAQSIAKLLAPHCERIHIAGSVRRQKPRTKKTATVVEKTDFWSAIDLNKAEMLALSQEIQELAETMSE